MKWLGYIQQPPVWNAVYLQLYYIISALQRRTSIKVGVQSETEISRNLTLMGQLFHYIFSHHSNFIPFHIKSLLVRYFYLSENYSFLLLKTSSINDFLPISVFFFIIIA